MSKIQDAVTLAKQWAADPQHGYDQSSRWGPNYDCSSLIIMLLEQVGIKVKSAGATYTGNMKSVFLRCGFELADVSALDLTIGAKLQAGDILLNEANHAAIYVGNNQIVHASINEKGGTTGGQSGDQTGKEVCIRSYYNYPWDCVLRYKENSTGVADKSTATTVKSTGVSDKSTGTYTVKAGDTLWSICGGDYSLVQQVAKLNGIDPNRLRIGQVLKMPNGSGTSANRGRKAELEAEVTALGGSVIWS